MTWPIVWNESRSVNEEENRFEEAAIEAEFETGYREETREEARRGVVTRLLRMTSGSLVTIIGVIMMPLPGPGLLIVAVGLGILSRDVAWADRLLQIVRKRLPSDSDGRLPRSSIVTMTVLALAGVAFSIWVTFLR
ncbi:MAG: hypothetical protein CL414_04425 [Acidimicrobiaceae bacterium]|jgi:uncharacterized protein (TIGR02611 family)|nr:hypothetical protein [Acidimicrobiaceae bacterium]MBO65175.1 hypothetical protein [Actinomycetota bacterium]MCH2627163.1 PGPGW domain-containing protein [Acidimicrobiales bacterium]